MPNQIKRLFAFDFDDTLAVTSSIIGVRRTALDGKSDPDFINWLREQGVNFYEIEEEKTKHKFKGNIGDLEDRERYT